MSKEKEPFEFDDVSLTPKEEEQEESFLDEEGDFLADDEFTDLFEQEIDDEPEVNECVIEHERSVEQDDEEDESFSEKVNDKIDEFVENYGSFPKNKEDAERPEEMIPMPEDTATRDTFKKGLYWFILGAVMILASVISTSRIESEASVYTSAIQQEVDEIQTSIIQGRDGKVYEVKGWINEVQTNGRSVHSLNDDKAFFEADWFREEVVNNPRLFLDSGAKAKLLLNHIFVFLGMVFAGYASYTLFGLMEKSKK